MSTERQRAKGRGEDSRPPEGHFFAISAHVVRRVLVAFARSRERRKRGGTSQRLSLKECDSLAVHHDAALQGLDAAA
jgi:hypothetical protein